MLETAYRLKYLVVVIVMFVLLVSGATMYNRHKSSVNAVCKRAETYSSLHNDAFAVPTPDQMKCMQNTETAG